MKGRDIEASTSSPALSPHGRQVAIAIGIDRYQHWRSLQNAASDALGVLELLAELGFETFIPPLLNEKATSNAIDALVSSDLDSRLGPDDSLVVFYAGHGGARTQRVGNHDIRTGYLIPVDATQNPDAIPSWIELEPWLNKIARLPARHILVLLDACFAGIALSKVIRWGRGGGMLPDMPFSAANAKTSRLLIASALADESAIDGGPMSGHSLFTGCILEALAGGATCVAQRDGRRLTIGSEVGRYVRNRVQTYPGRPGWRQTPDFGTFAYDDRGEMLIPLQDTLPIVNSIDDGTRQTTSDLIRKNGNTISITALMQRARSAAMTHWKTLPIWWSSTKTEFTALATLAGRLLSDRTLNPVAGSPGAAMEPGVGPAPHAKEPTVDISETEPMVGVMEAEPMVGVRETEPMVETRETEPVGEVQDTEPMLTTEDPEP